MNISFFSGNLGATARNATIKFGAMVDGAIVECEITEKALQEHFGAKTGLKADLVKALEEGRDRIQAVARNRLAHDTVGRCVIGSVDFE
jgi:Protein of unknown function (DUF1488)